MKSILIVLLTCATALAGFMATAKCSACSNPRLAMAGALFYGTLLAATVVFGVTRLTALALYGAFGFHIGLVATGQACTLCVACTSCSSAIALLLLRTNASMLVAAPWTAALALSLIPPASSPRIVTVYEQAHCPHCEELRTHVMPEAIRDLDVNVRYQPAPLTVRATPTIVIGRRTIEGVPPAPLLRRAILENLAP